MKNRKFFCISPNRKSHHLLFVFGAVMLLLVNVGNAQTRIGSERTTTTRAKNPPNGGVFNPQAGGALKGTGTAGMIPKWFDSTTLTDSIISESNGRIGIGIPNAGSKLSVAGMIETTIGGYKFPDGTIQTSAAASGLSVVSHNSSLTGNGTASSPLAVTVPLFIGGSAPSAILSVTQNGSSVGISAFATENDAVVGSSTTGIGVHGISQDLEGVAGSSNSSIGVHGLSSSNIGVSGFSETFWGVAGVSHGTEAGVIGGSIDGPGVRGESTNNDGVLGMSSFGNAGRFLGNVVITGNLAKAGGSFKIDHPLDPENKYLYHSFVESPDMMNIYNGNATTDENGDVVVKLPAYFEALNFEFRYQLTVIGQFAQAIVARKIKNNEFAIKTNVPGVEVSWQVTGIRRDAWANQNRIPVEVEKKKEERGLYLHPEAFGQPTERSVQSRQLLRQTETKKSNQ